MTSDETRPVTLSGGPHDGLQLDVAMNETKVLRKTESGRQCAVYQETTVGAFMFSGYMPIVKGKKYGK